MFDPGESPTRVLSNSSWAGSTLSSCDGRQGEDQLSDVYIPPCTVRLVTK
jgi:hypothetical protein